MLNNFTKIGFKQVQSDFTQSSFKVKILIEKIKFVQSDEILDDSQLLDLRLGLESICLKGKKA